MPLSARARKVRSALLSKTQESRKPLTDEQLNALVAAIDPLMAKLKAQYEGGQQDSTLSKPTLENVIGLDPFDPTAETQMLVFPRAGSRRQIQKLAKVRRSLVELRDSVTNTPRARDLLTRSIMLIDGAYRRLDQRFMIGAGGFTPRPKSVPDRYHAELLFQLADTFRILGLPLVPTRSGAFYQTAITLLGRRAVAQPRIQRALDQAKEREAFLATSRSMRSRVTL